MNVQIYKTHEEMSAAAADFLVAQLLMKPDCHMGLTAGATPQLMFDILVKRYQDKHVSFAKCTLYNLEEYVDVPSHDPATLRVGYFHRRLLDHVDATDEQLLMPDGYADGIEEACRKYDALMDSLPDGRLDFQLLGIGADAHIGMNKPNETLSGPAHPAQSVSGHTCAAMGLRHIWKAKKLLLIANGEAKAEAVAKMVNGPITTMAPASLLQLHPDVTIMLDAPAASKL